MQRKAKFFNLLYLNCLNLFAFFTDGAKSKNKVSSDLLAFSGDICCCIGSHHCVCCRQQDYRQEESVEKIEVQSLNCER